MKKKFLNSSIQFIQKNGNYTDEQLEIIKYGLEGIYLTFTKMIILFCLAYVLDVLKEFVFLLLSYNVIRSQAFGIHATKSIYCLVSSILLFIGGALLCKYVIFNTYISIIIALICDVCLFLYAPADTHKRPLVNKKKRKRFKFVSLLFGFVYTIFIIILRDNSISIFLVIGLVEAVLMILPITYQIFHLPYNNYKTYYSGV